jgi:hypothetical protein
LDEDASVGPPVEDLAKNLVSIDGGVAIEVAAASAAAAAAAAAVLLFAM